MHTCNHTKTEVYVSFFFLITEVNLLTWKNEYIFFSSSWHQNKIPVITMIPTFRITNFIRAQMGSCVPATFKTTCNG